MQDGPNSEPEKGLPQRFSVSSDLLAELRHRLLGSTVWRIRGGNTRTLLIDFGDRASKASLLLSAHPQLGRLHLVTGFRVTKKTFPLADRAEKLLRGAELIALEFEEPRREVRFHFLGVEASPFALILKLPPRPNLSLLDSTGQAIQSMRPLRDEDRDPEFSVSRSAPSPQILPPETAAPSSSPSSALERLYSPAESKESARLEAKETHQRIKTRLRSLRRRREKLTRELEAAEKGPALQQTGEILKASFHELRRGMKEIELPNYYEENAPLVKIPLIEDKSPQENLEAVFKRARKALRSLPFIEEKLARAASEEAALEDALEELARKDPAEPGRPPEQILEELLERGFLRRRPDGSKQKGTSKPASDKSNLEREIRRFRSVDGLEMLVGKSDRANDRLVKTLAKGEDLWLHAQGVPGSHVVVRLARNQSVPQETLLDAAHLAAHFSKAKDWAKADVLYTKRKYVQKGKRQPPGQVTCSKTSTLYLRVDPERLNRLFDRGLPGSKPTDLQKP